MSKKKIVTIILTILLIFPSISVYATADYDLRDHIDIAIKNQGTTGACWILAMSTVFETNLALKNSEEVEISGRHMDYGTSQSFKNDAVNENGFNKEVNTGGIAEFALAYLTNGIGPVLEEEMPFSETFGDINLEEITSKKTNYQVDKWIKFPSIIKYNDGTYTDFEGNIYRDSQITLIRNKIKEHIVENGAVYAGTNVATGFANYYNRSNHAYYCADNALATDHAIVIIGWDDNYPKENFKNMPENNGAYIVQNSWGDDVRLDNGVFYVSYEDKIIERDMYGIVNVSNKNYENIYQYDELGRNQYFEITGLDTAYGANVFKKTSENPEVISHVGISTFMDVECEVYINPKDGSFDESKLIKVGEGYLQNGYNTVYLDEEIEISGEKFAVVVKYGRVEELFGVTTISRYEEEGEAPYLNVTSEAGESYIGISLKNMQDLYDIYENTNVCIKAFTTASLASDEEDRGDGTNNDNGDKPENITLILGDVNGDSKISVTDASILKRVLVKLASLENESIGDINKDGKISATDLSMLLQKIVGK